MPRTLKWGIIATGTIAGKFVEHLKQAPHAEIAAVASREGERAVEFARKHDIPQAFQSYEELLADDDVDIAYISTPHPMHKEWCIKSAEAGKGILCEKPAAMNAAELEEILQAVKANDIFFMEAFKERAHPQTKKVIELIRANEIGEVGLVEASFAFQEEYDPEGRHYKKALGGGAILDVGCYPVAISRLIAGSAAGKPFLDPEEVKGSARLCDTGVDDRAAAALKFSNGVLAQVFCATQLDHPNVLRIHGSRGRIEVRSPWNASPCEIRLYRGKNVHDHTVECDLPVMAYEAEAAAASWDEKQAPEMSWDDSRGNARTLDLWLREAGVSY